MTPTRTACCARGLAANRWGSRSRLGSGSADILILLGRPYRNLPPPPRGRWGTPRPPQPSAGRRTVTRPVRLIGARCEVTFTGRLLPARLPEAPRVVLGKRHG